MSAKAPSFKHYFEVFFLENCEALGLKEKKLIDKSLKLLASNPRHRSLKLHKAKNVKAMYPKGGDSFFIAYATKDLRLTF